jgi:ankyrin repeat protein
VNARGRRLLGAAALLLLVPDAGLGAGSDGSANPAFGTVEAPAPAPFTLEQRYLDAARRGDRATLERALERGVALEARDDLGRGALLLAAKDAGSLDLVRWLAQRGAASDAPDAAGRAALSFAAAEGRVDLVQVLAGLGAEIDRRDEDGRTPLFHAASLGHRPAAAELLARGASANVADRFGDTPLMLACAKGDRAMAELLVAHGADPGKRDQEGRIAAQRGAAGPATCADLAPPA